MVCIECGALLLDAEIEQYDEICEDCHVENHEEEDEVEYCDTCKGVTIKNNKLMGCDFRCVKEK